MRFVRIYYNVATYAKKLRKRHRWIKPAIILAIVAGLSLIYYFVRIAPVLTTVVQETVKMQVSQAIDDMTDSELHNVKYEDLVITRYNDEGYVSLLQVNSVNVDLFARKVTALIRTEMAKFEDEGVSIPIGTLSGIPFISGIGPNVELNLMNLGIVDADFISEFVAAGLNQTIHRLYMRIIVNMTIVLPGYTLAFDNSSQVIICESVIAGEVPFSNIDLGGITTSELLP